MIDEWKALIAKAKIPKVIAKMLDRLEFLDDQDYSHQMIMISSRQEELKKKLAQELISEENGRIAQNKIKASILMLIEELEDDEVDLGGNQATAPIETPVETPAIDSPTTDVPPSDTPSKDAPVKDAPIAAPGLGVEVATPQEAASHSLDKLKEKASLKLRELKSLRKEETFTLPGANLFKIQLNIEELEKEMDSLKEQIRNFGSDSEE